MINLVDEIRSIAKEVDAEVYGQVTVVLPNRYVETFINKNFLYTFLTGVRQGKLLIDKKII